MTDSASPGLALRTLKNSTFGMAGFVWPVLLALFTTPFIVRTMGADLYGVFSIVGVTLGFFGFLDFGIGGAATRQVAAYYEKKEHDNVGRVVSAVLAFYLVIGVLVGGLILALTNALVTQLLGIPTSLQQAATIAFYVAAPSFMTALVSGAFLSIPSALQRYDIATTVSIGLTTLNAVITVSLLAMGYRIVAIMVAGLVVSLLVLPIEYVIARRLVPQIRLRPRWDPAMLKELFSFGGYFLLSSLGVLMLYQADKLLIGHFLGVGAVTYYVVPGSLAQKIQGLVAASAAVIFPLSAALFETKKRATLENLYREGTRLVFILVMMMAVPMAVFAYRFLLYWMGPKVASNSGTPMVLLVITYAILAVSSVPWGIANGSGRAKINAYFTLAIAAIDVGAFLVLVGPYGLNGAAAAYLLSAVLGVPVLIAFIERRVLGLSGFEFLKEMWRVALVGVVQTGIALMLLPLATRLLSTVALMVLSALAFPMVYWSLGFAREGDRRLISLVAEKFRR
jgi:O-antigen/teichoic acid export membrane protein